MKELEIAQKAARIGGDIVARYFREGVEIRSKDAHNLVTDADIESEKAIVDCIRETFPEHEVMGEEGHTADVSAEHLWIIDPLDGTTNFAHQIPHFAVSIAYFFQGKPACGAIWNPIRDDWYLAARGQGATHNGEKVSAATETQLKDVLVGVGFYYDRGAMMEATLSAIRELFEQQIHGIRRFGTASLDLAQVGCGLFGAFFEYELSPWDFAAGQLFVEEAGGTITDCRGEELPIEKSSVLASNTHLHPAVLDIVKRNLPD